MCPHPCVPVPLGRGELALTSRLGLDRLPPGCVMLVTITSEGRATFMSEPAKTLTQTVVDLGPWVISGLALLQYWVIDLF